VFLDGEDELEDGDADADDHPDGEEIDSRRRPAQTQQHIGNLRLFFMFRIKKIFF
jgi:hypothetical protein